MILRQSEISVVLEIYAFTSCDTMSYKFTMEKVPVLKKICKGSSSFTSIKMLRLNISLTLKLQIEEK